MLSSVLYISMNMQIMIFFLIKYKNLFQTGFGTLHDPKKMRAKLFLFQNNITLNLSVS